MVIATALLGFSPLSLLLIFVLSTWLKGQSKKPFFISLSIVLLLLLSTTVLSVCSGQQKRSKGADVVFINRTVQYESVQHQSTCTYAPALLLLLLLLCGLPHNNWLFTQSDLAFLFFNLLYFCLMAFEYNMHYAEDILSRVHIAIRPIQADWIASREKRSNEVGGKH